MIAAPPARSQRRTNGVCPAARTLDRLQAIDAAAWDHLVLPGSGGLRHAFLRAWERCELPGLESRPLLIPAPGGEGLLAAAAAYLFDLDLASVHQLAQPWLLDGVRRAWPRLMTARVLEIGAPVAHVHPLMLAQSIEAQEAASAILDAAIAEAETAGASFTIVQDHVPLDSPLALALQDRGFAALQTLPTAVLEQHHDSFDDYLAAMRSKYRNRARRVIRDSAHLHVERVEDFGALSREFSALWRLVHERATETRREILAEPFFTAAATLPETAALVLRRTDGSIAAFGLVLEDEPWLHFLQCGFTKDAGRNEAAYFRLLLEVVRSGIDGSFRFIHLGCTTLGPKLDVGAIAVPLYAWIRHQSRLVHLGCHLVARVTKREVAPAPRNVFVGRR